MAWILMCGTSNIFFVDAFIYSNKIYLSHEKAHAIAYEASKKHVGQRFSEETYAYWERIGKYCNADDIDYTDDFPVDYVIPFMVEIAE